MFRFVLTLTTSKIAGDDGAEIAEFVVEGYEATAARINIRSKSAEFDWISSAGVSPRRKYTASVLDLLPLLTQLRVIPHG